MWEYLDKPIALFLIVALPLAWGLAIEYVFELRRRRARPDREKKSPDDGDSQAL